MKPQPNIQPSREAFSELATKGNLIPVFIEISADHITPISVYYNIRILGAKYSYLLESADRTEVVGRYSIIGKNPQILIKSKGDRITITGDGKKRSYRIDGDPLEEIKKFMSRYQYVPSPKLLGFSGGAVGYVGYDAVSTFEKKVSLHKKGKGLNVPDTYFMIADQAIVFDHLTKKLYLVVNASLADCTVEQAYKRAEKALGKLLDIVMLPNLLAPLTAPALPKPPELVSNTAKEEFMDIVMNAKEYILNGDIFQVVLSQRFETEYRRDPINLYRMLWMINPSPYMFCMSFGKEVSVVGSSPEVHVRLTGDKVEIRPIAGTRKRGATVEEDIANEKDLLSDPKEIAEHIMLVDLARNDVGRDAAYGSVQVTDRMSIERFSHVMHIVSSIEGKVMPGKDAYDVMRSTFPAGTVSGSPKIRAMNIIADMEKQPRGIYSGAVGYFGFNGNMDSCIALRTVVLKDNKAFVQAGAGIVADSTPEGEYQECINKAMGMLRAIECAKS